MCSTSLCCSDPEKRKPEVAPVAGKPLGAGGGDGSASRNGLDTVSITTSAAEVIAEQFGQAPAGPEDRILSDIREAQRALVDEIESQKETTRTLVMELTLALSWCPACYGSGKVGVNACPVCQAARDAIAKTSPGPVHVRCSCGRTYSREQWLALPWVGRWNDDGQEYETRTCSCGSSQSVEVHS